jgi:hypothetical protein
MGSILDIDSSLNTSNEAFERYYSIGNAFKLVNIRNVEFVKNHPKNHPVTRPLHDIWLDLIFDVDRVVCRTETNTDMFGEQRLFEELDHALGIDAPSFSPLHKLFLAKLLNVIYENNSVVHKLNECKSKDYALDTECGFFLEGSIVDLDIDEDIMSFQKRKRGELFSKVVKIVFDLSFDRDIRLLTLQIPYMFNNGNYVHEGELEFLFIKRSEPLFNI